MNKKEELKVCALELAQTAFDKKGRDITILDMENISLLADYFVIISANNAKQTQAIASELEDKGVELGLTVKHTEGFHAGDWILVDFGDVICHVFGGDEREHYGLENLWRDANVVEFEGV